MENLQILPKLRDSLSYVYAEHAIIERERDGISILQQTGQQHVPMTTIGVLLIGPGVSITHGAMLLLGRAGCSVLWVGEDGTRFYAAGTGETRRGQRLLGQARAVSDDQQRALIVRRMYIKRFDETLADDLSLPQIRGMEGVRMRNAYAHASRRYGVEWNGRNYDRQNWGQGDPINRALSAANALLNGLCHSAIVSGGYSAGLGFIHTGLQLSFVYDVADLYKTELTIPIAFEMTAQGTDKLEARVRQRCRERFKETKLLSRILPDIDALLQIVVDVQDDAHDQDGALPGALWPDTLTPPVEE
jgi:CRISP-associated protein Cas1